MLKLLSFIKSPQLKVFAFIVVALAFLGMYAWGERNKNLYIALLKESSSKEASLSSSLSQCKASLDSCSSGVDALKKQADIREEQVKKALQKAASLNKKHTSKAFEILTDTTYVEVDKDECVSGNSFINKYLEDVKSIGEIK